LGPDDLNELQGKVHQLSSRIMEYKVQLQREEGVPLTEYKVQLQREERVQRQEEQEHQLQSIYHEGGPVHHKCKIGTWKQSERNIHVIDFLC